jgi:hypothetical protein
MLIWGARSETKVLVPMGTERCPTCEQERPFRLVLHYRYAHLWYVVRWVTRRIYSISCEVCGRGGVVDRKTAEAHAKGDPIPFITRWSWAFFAGVVVVALATGAIGNHHQRDLVALYLQAPAVNDRYLMDVAKLTHQQRGKASFGIMRLRAINEGQLEFEPSRSLHEHLWDARVDLGGRAKDAGYYRAETMTVPLAELPGLRAEGAVIDVERE